MSVAIWLVFVCLFWAHPYGSPQRKEAIVDYIIQHHGAKTQGRTYCAMMCVQDTDAVIAYYELLRAKRRAGQHDLKVATIFSFAQNEDPIDFGISTELSVVEEPRALYGLPPHRRELLDDYIGDFNQLFGTAHSTRDSKSFYNYYNDVSKMAKNKAIDLLLVANMLLTGFDSKWVNTPYVDKNLRYHGLIQAFSRTNRTHDKNKAQGNIVCFRNLKDRTDEAITLFGNKDAIDEVVVKPYPQYVEDFNAEVARLRGIVPEVQAVDGLHTEEEQMLFILAFRALLRLHKKMAHYTDFDWADLDMEEQDWAGYSSKYLDLKDRITHKTDKTKVSILDDIDFELELIRRDNINVTYIVQLLIKLKSQGNPGDQAAIERQILNLLQTDVTLRSKRELIARFIRENMVRITDVEDISEAFDAFWRAEEVAAFNELVRSEHLSAEKARQLVEGYLFSQHPPLRDDVLALIEGEKPPLLQRATVGERILQRLMDFVATFIEGMGA